MTHRQFWDGIIHLKTHATLPLTCTEEYELAQANRAWGVHSTDIYLGEKRLFVPLFCSFIQYPQDIPGTMESGKRSSGSGMRLALETRFFFSQMSWCHGHKLQDGRLSDFPWLGMLPNSQQSDPSLGSRVVQNGGLSPSRDKAEERLSTVLVHFWRFMKFWAHFWDIQWMVPKSCTSW